MKSRERFGARVQGASSVVVERLSVRTNDRVQGEELNQNHAQKQPWNHAPEQRRVERAQDRALLE
jgi:hypothetical protein